MASKMLRHGDPRKKGAGAGIRCHMKFGNAAACNDAREQLQPVEARSKIVGGDLHKCSRPAMGKSGL